MLTYSSLNNKFIPTKILIIEKIAQVEGQLVQLSGSFVEYKKYAENVSYAGDFASVNSNILSLENQISTQLSNVFKNIAFLEETNSIKEHIETSETGLLGEIYVLKDTLGQIEVKFAEAKDSLSNNASNNLNTILSELNILNNALSKRIIYQGFVLKFSKLVSFSVDDNFEWANNKDRRHNCIIHTLHIYVKFEIWRTLSYTFSSVKNR